MVRVTVRQPAKPREEGDAVAVMDDSVRNYQSFFPNDNETPEPVPARPLMGAMLSDSRSLAMGGAAQ